MRRLLLPFVCATLATAALTAPACAADPTPIIQADRAFAALSREQGPTAAFKAYMANPVIKFENPKIKVTPDEAADFPPGGTLDWTVEEGDLAASGDLGYTWGRWTFQAPRPDGRMVEVKGKYVSVWKKQADGSWKVVLDTGSPDQPPMPAKPATPPQP